MSNNIFKNTNLLSNSVNKQNTEIDFVANAITKSTDETSLVTTNIKDIASAIKVTEEISDQNVQLLQQLNNKMTQVVSLIKKVVNANEAVNTHSVKINDSISQLRFIANQISLLSFNASIQSVQSGANGKGFSVVASEMKVLSDESAKFTNIIEELFKKKNLLEEELNETISEESMLIENSISTVYSSLKAIETQRESVSKIKDNIDNIYSYIEKLREDMLNISSATNGANKLATSNLEFIHNISATIAEENKIIGNAQNKYSTIDDMIYTLSTIINIKEESSK